MAELTHDRDRRRWADVLAIVTGVSLFGISLWPSIMSTSPEGRYDTRHPGTLVLVRVAVAVMAIGAVALAQRWERRAPARALLVVGAVALVATLVMFRDATTWEFWSLLVPAVALVVAATGIGPMPGQE
jgi:peptidoglycan/LPS O-acetylase OafA/YrhL